MFLTLIQCKEDKTEWIYDLSKYEEKNIISVQVTHPFQDDYMKKPLMIIPNQTVYIFESGAVLWRTY